MAGWAGAAMALSLAGPFGTYDALSWPLRSAYWAAVTGVGLGLALVMRHWARRCSRGMARWKCEAVFAAGFAASFTPVLYGATAIVAWEHEVSVPLLHAGVASLVLPLSLVLLLALFRGRRPETPVQPRLLERLAPEGRGELLRVSGRDHYVDVVTTAGRAELLMRFSDALRELEGLDGLRVHRSHWVAASAVAAVERGRDRMFLRLACGKQIPVSRTYRAAVDARWPG